MLAKGVNDNAALQVASGVLKFFASKLAPTGEGGKTGAHKKGHSFE
ncbi:hypothetical protein C4J89_4291 [Pseudomonas sp. R4-35-07]|nr:hypothetical protein C4J89_4291 [Pseudomonas sp. R4-35-07]